MPAKGQKLTEEQRKVLGERLAKAREVAAANRAAAAADETEAPAQAPTEATEPTISLSEYRDLLKQIEELKRVSTSRFSPTPQPQYGPQVNNRGMLTGTFEKYLVDPKNYPDPSARLAQEPRLQRFAFPINYELSWEVSTTSYETKDGVNTKEPRFTLKLIKIHMDDEGNPTTGRYVLRTLMAHEDPQAALTIARQQGLEPNDFGSEANFLNEMRYLRFRDWLIEAFYPPKSTAGPKTKEMVIGNRVVEFYETSGEESQKIPFDKLNGKV